ncbi:MAG TPA: hypothetical protein VJM12_22875, partial [Pyrinomonadaceae bacterium]|nr:hypothetical protein [Pyrinomonadaceae bacterium]
NKSAEPVSVAVSVSILFNELGIGTALPEEVGPYYRLGEQTLMVYRGEKLGLLLPFVASMYNYDRVAFAEAVREKSGLTEPPYYWCRFDCTTWLADAEGVWPTAGGFLRVLRGAVVSSFTADPENRLLDYGRLHARYLLKQLRPDGSLYSAYDPFQNRLYEGVYLPRLAHAAWVLARSANVLGCDSEKLSCSDFGRELRDAADRVIEHLIGTVTSEGDEVWLESGDETPSVAEIAFLLMALCELPPSDPRRSLIKKLAKPLWASIDLHGRISTHRECDLSADDAYQDYFPGQVLLALATATEQATACERFQFQAPSTKFQLQSSNLKDQRPKTQDQIQQAFRYYRHRFRYKRHFGQVSWLLQAFSKWWHVTHESAFAEFVFEITDWLLEYQQEKVGAFINDHQAESPGYTTAVYLEGLAAAMGVSSSEFRVPSSEYNVAADLEETPIGNRQSAIGNSIKNEDRYRKYHDSFIAGYGFLDRLIIQERDRSILPNIDSALGGLRQGTYYSHIRTDFVQHSLSALLEFERGTRRKGT